MPWCSRRTVYGLVSIGIEEKLYVCSFTGLQNILNFHLPRIFTYFILSEQEIKSVISVIHSELPSTGCSCICLASLSFGQPGSVLSRLEVMQVRTFTPKICHCSHMQFTQNNRKCYRMYFFQTGGTLRQQEVL